MIDKAMKFAAKKHKDQKRKYTGEPYYNHCVSVYTSVKNFTNNENVICAALLHDTIEDTETTYIDLGIEFGAEVAKYVEELTDVYTRESYPNLNRKERKFLEACRLKDISIEAKLIKYFDLMDNTITIIKYDSKFAETYLKEKQFILTHSLGDVIGQAIVSKLKEDNT